MSPLVQDESSSGPPAEDRQAAAAGLERTSLLGIAAAFLLVIGIGVAAWRNLAHCDEALSAAQWDYRVMFELQETLTRVHDLALSADGYAVTGDRRYVEQHTLALNRLRASQQRLRRLTADQPALQARIGELDALLNQEAAATQRRIANQSADEGPGNSFQRSGGRMTIARLRERAAEISGEEQGKLNATLGALRARAGRAVGFVIAISALGLALALTLGAMVRRQFRRQREAAERLEQNRATLVTLFEQAADALIVIGPAGRITRVNRTAETLTGYHRAELVDQPVELLVPTALRADHAKHRAGFQTAPRRREMGAGLDLRARRKDGSEVPVDIMLSPLDSAEGPLVLATIRDLTERRRAEAVEIGQKRLLERIAAGGPLHEILAELIRFIETQAPDTLGSILLVDDRGECLRHGAAPSLPAAYTRGVDGIPIGAAAGSCGTAAHRKQPVLVEDIALDPLWAEYRSLALDHGLRACWATPVLDESHRVLATFAIYRRTPGLPSPHHRRLIEIATHLAAICLVRHRAETRIHEQAEVIGQARDAIIATDLDDRIVLWNEGAERILGWAAPKAIGRRLADLLGPGVAPVLEAARETVTAREAWQGEVKLRHRHGTAVVLDLRITLIKDAAGRPKSRLGIGTDITEKRQLEEQFLRAQRVECIGALAAGIAHDLNNVLSPIVMAPDMLRDLAASPEEVRVLGMLDHSARRGAALVRQILSFVQGAAGDLQIVDLAQLAREVADMMHETFPKSIQVDAQVAPHLWPVRARPAQLHQVLLNLCVNARDAMPHGGKLRLAINNRRLDEAAAVPIAGARAGAFVVIEVTDTGSGIAPELLDRIWEPFFSTKAPDRGTGLGLSTTRGIVAEHRGFITVESRVGQGSRFAVYVPAAEPSLAPTPRPPAIARGAGELILLVDDDGDVREMTRALLTRFGYTVRSAANGEEALALYNSLAAEVRLVVSDLNMPKLDGARLAEALHRFDPALPLLFLSGGGGPVTAPPGAPTLQKPVLAEALLASVRELCRR